MNLRYHTKIKNIPRYNKNVFFSFFLLLILKQDLIKILAVADYGTFINVIEYRVFLTNWLSERKFVKI